MSATVIADLIERVGRAQGPDPILDRRICIALGVHPWTGSAASWAADDVMPGSPIAKATPLLSASIDAALALVERVLPGHSAGFQPCIGGAFRGHVIAITQTAAHLVRDAKGPTAPLAILLALLTALQSQTPGPTGASNEGGGHVG